MPDVHTFLQHLVTFGIVKKEDVNLYRKLVGSAWRKQMPKLAVSLGVGDEMAVSSAEMAVAKVVGLNHIAKETTDVTRLANFYKEIFGFVETESPDFGGRKVVWLVVPGGYSLHLIERDSLSKLPESPYTATSPVRDPSHLPRAHHICFSVSNFDTVVQAL